MRKKKWDEEQGDYGAKRARDHEKGKGKEEVIFDMKMHASFDELFVITPYFDKHVNSLVL